MEKVLYILTGPTAIGKTELALQWAEQNDAEILSCDSLLFYQGMDIGTAKPSKDELARIKHHGIDILSVQEQFSVKDYLTLAQEIVHDILSRGKKVLVTGGSGFYLQTFMAPVVDNIEVPQTIKDYVKVLEEEKGLQGLVRELKKLNKGSTIEGSIDLKNSRRVIKALQRCLTTKKDLKFLKQEFEKATGPFDDFKKKVCLLQRDETILKQRVILRVKAMLELGLVDEVKRLQVLCIDHNESAAKAIGYKETLAWLNNENDDINELGIEIVKNTMALVAKQRKWFRHQLTPDTKVDLDNKYELNELFSI